MVGRLIQLWLFARFLDLDQIFPGGVCEDGVIGGVGKGVLLVFQAFVSGEWWLVGLSIFAYFLEGGGEVLEPLGDVGLDIVDILVMLDGSKSGVYHVVKLYFIIIIKSQLLPISLTGIENNIRCFVFCNLYLCDVKKLENFITGRLAQNCQKQKSRIDLAYHETHPFSSSHQTLTNPTHHIWALRPFVHLKEREYAQPRRLRGRTREEE